MKPLRDDPLVGHLWPVKCMISRCMTCQDIPGATGKHVDLPPADSHPLETHHRIKARRYEQMVKNKPISIVTIKRNRKKKHRAVFCLLL